jgi:[protein]-arginine 3-hydroxylase / protease
MTCHRAAIPILWIRTNAFHPFSGRPRWQSTMTTFSIDICECPPHASKVATLLQPYYTAQQPLILRGMAQHWRAFAAWKHHEYLLRAVEDDDALCEVETGLYNQGERVTLLWSDYVHYVQQVEELQAQGAQGSIPIYYLAQNDLPTPLKKDIEIPPWCTDANYDMGQGKLYQSMLWMGPAGCVSPLHFDPLDNLLVQVKGRKQVTLVSKDESAQSVYAGKDYNQQYNTSAVDVESVDTTKYPLFQNVPLYTGILMPSDGLFIPAKWWHHIRSLDSSISVNFWWR